MRRFILGLLLCSVFLQAAYRAEPGLAVQYGGKKLHFQHTPVSIGDTVYVPLAECAQQLGLTVEQTGERFSITRAADMRTLKFSTRSRTIKINNDSDELSNPLLVIRDTSYIALNEFVWLFGYFAERTGTTITLVTKIKTITFDKQLLQIRGQAPLAAKVLPDANGYTIVIDNCILGNDQQDEDIVVEDGTLVRIRARQQSLSPAVVAVRVEARRQVAYTVLKEDTDNALLIRFDYTPVLQTIAPAAASTQAVWQKILDEKTLWLPEQTLGSKGAVRFVLRGTAYPAIPVGVSAGKLMVPFDEVFGALGCTLTQTAEKFLITDSGKAAYHVAQGQIVGPGVAEPFVTGMVNGKVAVPLVQLLRIIGYAAHADKDTVYINPVIYHVEYQPAYARLLIKANDRLAPKQLQYLQKTAVLDIPFAAYVCTQNIYRTLAPAVAQVRAAQFAQGVVRIAMDIPSTRNKPVLSYEDNGRTLIVLFKEGKAQTLEQISVFSDKQSNLRFYFSGTTTLNGYTVGRLKDPDRLVIDFPNTVLSMANHLEVGKGPVKNIRLSQFSLTPQVTRVVLDVSTAYRAYSLGKDGALFVYAGATAAAKPVHATVTKPAEDYIARTYTFAEKIVPIIRESVQERQETPVKPVTPVVPSVAAATKPAVPAVLRGLRVAIIPGHGGSDAGAISRSGYMEKFPTLEVAQKLQKLLTEAGAIPLLCRERDENVTLEQQAEFANRNKADVLISIHFNSFINSSVGGAESYYYKPIDYDLAKSVHEEILRIRHVRNKGLKKACMHNLNHTSMPGVLIEPLFISNRQEEALIKDPAYQLELAKAIVRGIEKDQKSK